MLFQSLDDDVTILILQDCDMSSVLRVRQTCRRLSSMTRLKAVWLRVWKRYRDAGLVPTPIHPEEIDSFDATQLELYIISALTSETLWTQDAAPASVRRFDRPDTITWVSWLFARYFLVGSIETTDTTPTGILACYDCVDGTIVAQRRFPGPIIDGRVLVEGNHNIIALGVGGINASVFIVSLARQGGNAFLKCHAHHTEYAMPMALCGDIVVCGLRRGATTPYLLQWRTGASFRLSKRYNLEGPCRAAFLSQNLLIVIEPRSIVVYAVHGSSDIPEATVITSHPLGAIVTAASIAQCPINRTHAVVITTSHEYYDYSLKCSRSEIAVWTVSVHASGSKHLTKADNLVSVRKAGSSHRERPSSSMWEQTMHVVIGASAFRLLALTTNAQDFRLIATRCPPTGVLDDNASDDSDAMPPVDLEFQVLGSCEQLPPLWAQACIQYVEAYGILIIGNVFGELAILNMSPHGADLLSAFSFTSIPWISTKYDETYISSTYCSPLLHSLVSLQARASLLREEIFGDSDYEGDGWLSHHDTTRSNWDDLTDGWCGTDIQQLLHVRDELLYAGDIVPLLQNPETYTTFVYAGGTFLIYHQLTSDCWVLRDTSRPLHEVLGLLEDHWDSYLFRPAFYSQRYMWKAHAQSNWFTELDRGKNRWCEQHARGGSTPEALWRGYGFSLARGTLLDHWPEF